MRYSLIFLMLIIISSCVSPPPRTANETPPVRLIYTSNRHGEIEPCGCQVNQIGGMQRLQTFLEGEWKKTGPLVFADAGDTFFSAYPLNPRRREQEILRARVIAEGYRRLRLDAFTPGERDFGAGMEVLKDLESLSGASFVAANLRTAGGELLFPPFVIKEKEGVKVAFIGIVDVKAFETLTDLKVTESEAAIASAVKSAKSGGAEMIVLLSHSGLSRDRAMAKTAGVDVIVGAHSLDVLTNAAVEGKTLIVQPHNEGQQIGFLQWNRAEPLKSDHRLVDLGKDLHADNEIDKLMAEYREKIRQLAVQDSASVGVSASSVKFVANPGQCRTCHQKQYDFWAKTKHASAYLVLFAKNQHFDPECIMCHSIGFEDPRGFRKIAEPIVLTGKPARKAGSPFVETLMKKVFAVDTGKGALDSRTHPKRYAKLKKKYHDEVRKLEEAGKISNLYIGVQCEHCHGNRSGHPDPAVQTLKKVNETSCRSCHTPPNAPEFNPATMEKVACPLSSAKS